MARIRKCFYMIVTFCFLMASLYIHLLWAEEKASAQAKPQISFDAASYNAGEVWEGDKISHTFIVKNTGTAQLDITKVKPG